MAYDEKLAARVRKALEPTCAFTEKRMFGGLCFLIQGHMCCGVLKDELLLRLQPSEVAALLSEAHVRPMDFTGKAMRGFLYVGSQALTEASQFGAVFGYFWKILRCSTEKGCA